MSFTNQNIDESSIDYLNTVYYPIDYTYGKDYNFINYHIEDINENTLSNTMSNTLSNTSYIDNIYYKFNFIMLFLIYAIVIHSINKLYKINSFYYTGNISNRQYYPFYINVIQKTYKHAELVLDYLEDKPLQELIRTYIDNNQLSFINLRNYYYTTQNLYNKKLFHYGGDLNNNKQLIKLVRYTTSIGELNYIIWLIESGLLLFFIRKRTLLENRKNTSLLSRIKYYFGSFINNINDFHNRLLIYLEEQHDMFLD